MCLASRSHAVHGVEGSPSINEPVSNGLERALRRPRFQIDLSPVLKHGATLKRNKDCFQNDALPILANVCDNKLSYM